MQKCKFLQPLLIAAFKGYFKNFCVLILSVTFEPHFDPPKMLACRRLMCYIAKPCKFNRAVSYYTGWSSEDDAGVPTSTPRPRRRPPSTRRRRQPSTGRSLTGSEHGELLATSSTDERSGSVADTRLVMRSRQSAWFPTSLTWFLSHFLPSCFHSQQFCTPCVVRL